MAVRKRLEGRAGAGVLMRLEPTQAIASKIPTIGATADEIDPTIYIHDFCLPLGWAWWVAEYDPKTGLMFGFANLADDANAEWGEFLISDLESIAVGGGAMGVEKELHWRPKPFSECNAVRKRSTQLLGGDGTEGITANDPILGSGSFMRN